MADSVIVVQALLLHFSDNLVFYQQAAHAVEECYEKCCFMRVM
jgi:hypothetical protein